MGNRSKLPIPPTPCLHPSSPTHYLERVEGHGVLVLQQARHHGQDVAPQQAVHGLGGHAHALLGGGGAWGAIDLL